MSEFERHPNPETGMIAMKPFIAVMEIFKSVHRGNKDEDFFQACAAAGW